MTLQASLMQDMKEAMRRGEAVERDTIRLIRAAVQNEEISRGGELDDTGMVEVLSRMARQHRESIEAYRQHGRPELAAKEEAELAILLRYLPQQLSPEEVRAKALEVAQEVGAKGPADKGRVMGRLMPQLRGKADGAMANSIVTEVLEALGTG